MKIACHSVALLAPIIFLIGCGVKEAPLDTNGRTPQQVMMDTYLLVLEGNYAEAQKNFSAEFINEFITTKNTTFVDYCSMTDGWKVEWLKTKLLGNDYNDNVWRVRIIPDEGKGKHNRAGIVQDLYLIDGVWKIVFWGHYPKS